jgi:uncharacterized membrane protein YbhN (UPF0104 family)
MLIDTFTTRKTILMRKKLVNVLVYGSLIFLFFYLYKYDYFAFKEVDFKLIPLVFSSLFLWAGFVLSTVSWWNILHQHDIKISVKRAIISHGLAVFTKYIPGKIWSIIGRAGYISNAGFLLKTTSFISLKEQVIYIWEGLLISAIPMIFIYGMSKYSGIVILLGLFLTFLLFFKTFHSWFLLIFKRITKKELDIPFLNFSENLRIILYVFFYWLVWLLAFYLFVLTFYPETNIQVAFAFSLSITIGLLAFIFPAGIGIREGIMGSYLVLMGIPLEVSTVIAIYARIWFISGEIFIFLLALSLKLIDKNTDPQTISKK